MSSASACIVFAVLVSLTNWHYSRVVVSEHSRSSIEVSGPALTILFSIFALLYLGISLYKRIRKLLAEGAIIPRQIRLFDWMPCLFLAPLLLQISGGRSEFSEGGKSVVTKWGFGSEASVYALFFAVTVIILFQTYASLRSFQRKQE